MSSKQSEILYPHSCLRVCVHVHPGSYHLNCRLRMIFQDLSNAISNTISVLSQIQYIYIVIGEDRIDSNPIKLVICISACHSLIRSLAFQGTIHFTSTRAVFQVNGYLSHYIVDKIVIVYPIIKNKLSTSIDDCIKFPM